MRSICFCFRKQEEASSKHVLNRACALMSRYIHVEVYDSVRNETLYLIQPIERAAFRTHVYPQDLWDFIWLDISDAKYRVFRAACEQIVAEAVPFSHINAYCFLCFASCCYVQCFQPRSTNCTIITMQVIKALWGEYSVPYRNYAVTPEAIYNLIYYRLSSMDPEITLNAGLTDANAVPGKYPAPMGTIARPPPPGYSVPKAQNRPPLF